MAGPRAEKSRQRRLVAPCVRDCPAGIDVPRYIGYVAQGKFAEAQAVVRERIPFPAICGHVCYRPCTPACRRGQMDAPVSINPIKRAAMDYGSELWRSRWAATIAPDTGKRVAIGGSRPGGLTAAYYLGKRCGHDVTVFEAQSQPGGQLRLGVPSFRLPREHLDREIAVITETRVQILTNSPVTDLDALLDQGYDAVLVAVGAMHSKTLGIPGEDLPGVMDCASFLQAANLGQRVNVGRMVAVIGGGNVAMDGARTARRLGAIDVRILYRRTRHEMPAFEFEVKSAEEEGIVLGLLLAPQAITRQGEMLQLKLSRMALGEPDESGRRRPAPLPGSEFTMPMDTLLLAIGLDPAVPKCWGMTLKPDGTIQADPKTLETGHAGVFACGDAVTGPISVIEAIAGGRRAAQAVDRYLGGSGDISESLAPEPGDEMAYPPYLLNAGTWPPHQQEIPRDRRMSTFDEVEQGLTKEDAVHEALRCIRCDLWRIHGVPSVWPRKRSPDSEVSE